MNTERPDNDDAAEPGAVENTGPARDADDTVGAEESAARGEAVSEEAPAGTEAEESAARGEAVSEEAPAGTVTEESRAEAAQDADGTASVRSVGRGEAVHEADREEARAGRRRSSVIIASVAAAVLVVGGGGAYLAATASDGSDGGTSSGAPGADTPPPLALDGYSEGATGGIAPGEPNPYGATFQADGALPDGPGSAPVYRARGEVTADEVTRLATALGVSGKPVLQGQAWRIGAKDGSGPSLQVNQRAPGAWTFQRYAPGTDNCQSPTICADKPGGPAVDPVSEEAAKKAAAPVLKAVGQDDAKLDASQVMDAQRVVNAEPVVGGLPTYGWTTGVTVSAQGEVVGGSGQLKTPVKGDTYPVLSAEKTLSLMNSAPADDPRAGIGGCASPVPLEDGVEQPCGSDSTALPKKDTITVEKAVFGLASHYVDARQTLVPSWLFQVRAPGAQDSFTVTHPAIDPKFLASAAPSGAPTEQPSPRPTGPGDEQTTRNVTVEGYTTEGKELSVAFTGGVCADYDAKVSESGDGVRVTVTETPWPDKVCIMIAKTYHRTVQLDEPLGDRKVVGSDGKAIPLEKAGARLPETSGAR
ncbi:hypothetical protein [Streptomyces sp. P17]|uniref:hypothetical protein n=1 Tax=Streptomyces sp. P17 TaxID=3074716 RepID=UPI0028F4001B|nr:hypothetical protein [Streptomyces sp. P17]MDT9701002.1 hypothetical protein [Streptomyces sp. P17]